MVSKHSKTNVSETMTAIRSRFKYVVSQWRGLSEDQRFHWRNEATLQMVLNSKGVLKWLSGFQLFTHVNIYMLKLGQPLFLYPPSNAFAFLPVVCFISNPPGQFLVNFTQGAVPAFSNYIIKASAPYPNAVGAKHRSLKEIQTLGPLTNSPIDITSLYFNLFGGYIVGGQVAVRIIMFNYQTGTVIKTNIASLVMSV
jgi:hypothetical protein